MDEAIPGMKLYKDVRVHFYGTYLLISIRLEYYPKSIMEGDGIKKK